MEHTRARRSTRMSAGIRTLNTLESDRPQHDRPAACSLAQKYSSATFVSMRFLSRKEKSCTWYKIRDYFHFFRLQIYVRPKLSNFKLWLRLVIGNCRFESHQSQRLSRLTFFAVFSVSPGNSWKNALKSGHDRLLVHPLKFITFYYPVIPNCTVLSYR